MIEGINDVESALEEPAVPEAEEPVHLFTTTSDSKHTCKLPGLPEEDRAAPPPVVAGKEGGMAPAGVSRLAGPAGR